MELIFLALLILLMIVALGAGYPVAFALPGASIVTLFLAGATGYIFAGDVSAFFSQDGPRQWLSAGYLNQRGTYWEPERDTLIAIPLFIFMGIMLQRSRIAEDLLLTMASLFGPVPGGLGISVVFVGALLAATTGIVGATVVAMGLISLPAMLQKKYSQSLATGTIAASGTLGQIIPPSIVLIILADQLASAANEGNTMRKNLYKETTGELTMPSSFDVVSTSAGEMFLGAFLPGLVLVGLYMAYILISALLKPSIAPPVPYDGKYDRAFAFKVVLTLVPPLLLIFLVLGSIMAGIATVNQAGAIGAAGALIMSGYRLREGKRGAYTPAIITLVSILFTVLVISHFDTNVKNIKSSADALGVALAALGTLGFVFGLGWSGYRTLVIDDTLGGVMRETAKATSLVFIILLGAAILTAAFRAFGGEHLVKDFLEGLPGGFWTKFIIVMAVIFILGFFLDFIEIAVVVVPIVAPILLADPEANITAVWLGVMIGLNIQTSFLTPPFGFALFYLRGVADKTVKTINMYKGVIPFIALQIAALFIVAYAPSLVNYLPNRVSYLSENAPPPKNPKLNYCIGQYVSKRLETDKSALITAAQGALRLPLGSLPNELQDDLIEGFEAVPTALEAFDALALANAELSEAERNFAPLHRETRAIERDIRRYTRQIEALDKKRAQASDEMQAELDAQMNAINEDIQNASKEIPEDFTEQLRDFRERQGAVTQKTRDFWREASASYEPAAEITSILKAKAEFDAFEEELKRLSSALPTTPPEEMIETIEISEKNIALIAGTDEIKSALSKARRALKKKDPQIAKAAENLEKAERIYAEQQEWRAESGTLEDALSIYLAALKPSLGLKSQERMTREQALDIARCQSVHRNITLNF